MKLLVYLIIISAATFCISCNTPDHPLNIIAGKNDTTLLAAPFGMCVDPEGNLFVADAGRHSILKVNTKGEVTVFAGIEKEGGLDGNRKEASFNSPSGVFLDKKGNLYVAGFGGQNIRRITPEGEVSTVAGTGDEGYEDGPAAKAKFSSPRGVCMDSKANIFVADCWNHRIRKISPDGMVTTFAGGGKTGVLVENDWRDGQDTAARFDAPCGMAIDENDNVYVADANNHCIRKITPDGYVSTVAGIGKQKGLLDGPYGKALLNVPTEIFISMEGDLYISDTYNHCIRKMDKMGMVSTLVGNGEKGLSEDDPLHSLLSSPRGICLYDDYLFFAEWGNHTIRKLHLISE